MAAYSTSGWTDIFCGTLHLCQVDGIIKTAMTHVRISCALCHSIIWTNLLSYRWIWAAEGLQDGARVVFGGSIVCGDYLHAAVEIDHRLRKNNPNVVWVQMGVMETADTIFLPAMWRKELSA